MRLKGETAVVSGGAGGIGAAICERFAQEGAAVAALDLLPSATGALRLCCDLGDDDSVSEAARRIDEALGAVTIVVHAAAVAELATTLDTSSAAFNRIFNVNVGGAVRLARCFAPGMRARRRGAFVFVSSINSLFGAAGLAAYATSKGALDALMRTLAMELAPDNVRVNCVCPASVDTPLLQASFASQPDPALARDANIRRHPLGRLGTPHDVANLALFLASSEAAWITGAIYLIDGGASLARR